MLNKIRNLGPYLLPAFIGLLAIFGGLVYQVYQLNTLGLWLAFLLALITFGCLIYFITSDLPKQLETPRLKPWQMLAGAVYLILWALMILVLFRHQATGPLPTPWQVVPVYFFGLYGLSTGLLFLTRGQRFLTFLHYLLSFSVAVIIYKIGYGYDPFIHQAALKEILQNGSLQPKTFYYAGQYGLELILHQIFRWPLHLIDIWLLPVLAALTLPPLIRRVFNSNLLPIILLAIPLAIFIMTAPQNLAYLFLLLSVLLFSKRNYQKNVFLIIFALSAFFIHPLAGWPALLLVFIVVWRSPWAWSAIAGINLVSGPALIYLATKPSWHLALANYNWPIFRVAGSENLFLNTIYFFGFNYFYLALALLILALILLIKNPRQSLITLGFLGLGSFLSYLFTVNFVWPFSFGRVDSGYSIRLLVIALIFWLPLLALSLKKIKDLVFQQEPLIRLILLIFGSLLITISLYLSYPRFDHYYNSHGFSSSQADIEAVNFIASDAGASDYIVLANQQVSAMAIAEFGFKKYYNGLFYYSSPNNYQLYNYYLQMIDNSSVESIAEVKSLIDVPTVYVVLNRYWSDFDIRLAKLKTTTQEFYEIGSGQVYIFKY